MASNQAFVDYVCDQLSGAPGLAAKKMFGEYAVFCESRMLALIGDKQLFLKPTQAGRALLQNPTEAPPYRSEKNYFLIDAQLDDAPLLRALIEATAHELPLPKPKAKAKTTATAKVKTTAKAKRKNSRQSTTSIR